MSKSIMSDVPEVNFIFAFLALIIAVVAYGLYYDHVNKFYVNKNFLKCSYSEVVKVGSGYNFECKEYDVIPLGRQEINKSDTEIFNRINEHCISFRENGNCQTVITNYTAKEFKNMLSGEKKINTDVLGYLK